jgi:hypothetical protein
MPCLAGCSKPSNPSSGSGGTPACSPTAPCPGSADLEIVDRKTGSVVSGTTQTKIVGQKVELQARSKPPGHSLSNIQWTISGTTPGTRPASTVKSYSMALARTDAPTLLTSTDLQGQTLDLYWVPVQGEGSQTVSVRADVDGTPKQAQVTFNVRCPSLDSFTSVTGPIAIGNPWGSGRELHCGTHTNPGLKYTAKTTPPANGDGEIKFTQILQAALTQTPTSGPQQTWTIPDWWLDIDDPYANHGPNAVSASTQATTSDNDSPGLPLQVGFRDGTVSMTFKLYLMYKPAGADSIWVPLGLLNWGWSGAAHSADGGTSWTKTSGAHNANNPSGAKTGEFPTWVDRKTDSPAHPTWQ